MTADPRFYRLIGAIQPKIVNDLIIVEILLKNMRGEQKQEKIVFNNMTEAWEFYLAQQKMVKNGK